MSTTVVVKNKPGRKVQPNSLASQAKVIYDSIPDASTNRAEVMRRFLTELKHPDGRSITKGTASVYHQVIRNPALKSKRKSQKKVVEETV